VACRRPGDVRARVGHAPGMGRSPRRTAASTGHAGGDAQRAGRALRARVENTGGVN